MRDILPLSLTRPSHHSNKLLFSHGRNLIAPPICRRDSTFWQFPSVTSMARSHLVLPLKLSSLAPRDFQMHFCLKIRNGSWQIYVLRVSKVFLFAITFHIPATFDSKMLFDSKGEVGFLCFILQAQKGLGLLWWLVQWRVVSTVMFWI